MKVWICLPVGIALLIAGCSPAAPIPTEAPPVLTETPTTAPTNISEPTGTASPTTPATATETPSPTPEFTATPEATLTEWQAVQAQVEGFRNRLAQQSDGYNGLTQALAQSEPNEDWCGGLNAAIGDFDYAGDQESAQALEALQEAQGCP